MSLNRFGVKNYKCLGEIDIPLTPIHVVIGQNDSGKTSLLEALAAFFASSERLLHQVFPGPWSGRELVFHGSSEPRIEFCGSWPVGEDAEGGTAGKEFKYGFAVEFPPSGQACSTTGDWGQLEGEQQPISRVDKGDKTSLFRCKHGQKNPSDFQNVTYVELISPLLKPAHKYALDAKLMAVPAAIDPQRKFRLDPDGFGLPTLLDDILGFDPNVFLRIREEFCALFPQFKSVRVESEAALNRHFQPTGIHSSGSAIGKGVYFETNTGQTIRAQQASDGAILFLGLLALAHLPEPPTLLLIEEPENGIYPKRLGEVIQLLKQMVYRTEGLRFPQIILSTHSPYVLSFFEPEEVTFLSRAPDKPDAPVRARPLRDAPNIKERLAGGEFFLGELWYNLSEEELFGEP